MHVACVPAGSRPVRAEQNEEAALAMPAPKSTVCQPSVSRFVDFAKRQSATPCHFDGSTPTALLRRSRTAVLHTSSLSAGNPEARPLHALSYRRHERSKALCASWQCSISPNLSSSAIGAVMTRVWSMLLPLHVSVLLTTAPNRCRPALVKIKCLNPSLGLEDLTLHLPALNCACQSRGVISGLVNPNVKGSPVIALICASVLGVGLQTGAASAFSLSGLRCTRSPRNMPPLARRNNLWLPNACCMRASGLSACAGRAG